MAKKQIFNGATYHVNEPENKAKSAHAVLPPHSTEEEREACHQMIDYALSANPAMAKRAHLMTDIAISLEPWIQENELDHVMTGMRYISTAKLIELNQHLQDKETTYSQKALITKTILSKGYFHYLNKKLTKQLIIQPLMLLSVIGSFGYFCYGASKGNDRTAATSAAITLGAYFIADRSQKKFKKETQEARYFLNVMIRNPDEQKRVENERQKWFTQPQTNSR